MRISNGSARPAWRGPFLVAVAISTLYCTLAASRTWPVVDGDGLAYFPAAVEWSRGRGLVNPVWLPPLNDSIDGPNGRRLIYHGFTYAVLTGTIGRWLGGGPGPTVWAAYAVHWLAAVLGALAVLRGMAADGAAARVLGFLAPLAMLACSIATHGRPEPLVLLLVSLAVLVWQQAPAWVADASAGAAAALLLFTSPACGLLAPPLLAAALAASHVQRPWLRRAAGATGGWLAGATAAVAIYPFPIADWFGGVRRHGLINLGLPLGQGLLPTWVSWPELPLLAVTMLVLLAVVAAVLTRALIRTPGARRLVAAFGIAAFLVGLTRVAVMKSEAYYNAVVWLPLIAALASSSRRRFDTAAIVVALALPSAGLARSTLLLARQFTPAAVTYEDARTTVGSLRADQLSISGGLWMTVDDPSAVNISGRDRTHPPYLVQQQSKTGQRHAGAVPGYTLSIDRFGAGVSLFGWPISRTPGGWEFAIYTRTP